MEVDAGALPAAVVYTPMLPAPPAADVGAVATVLAAAVVVAAAPLGACALMARR